MSAYALKLTLPGATFHEAVARTREALLAAGFGIPTEMNTQAIFQAKLGKHSPARVILGACLAPVAYEALELEPDLAVLLPCNVVVREVQEGVEIAAVAPTVLFTLTERVPAAHAEAVEARLRQVLEALS